MRKALLLSCLCLSLLSFTAFAETPASDIALFPARAENGLWGYIDSQGTWVIEPQFNYAYGFRGNYAEVTVYPEGFVPDETQYMGNLDMSGIIDRNGTFVLPPTYSLSDGYDEQYYGGKDTGIWWITRWQDDVWGEDEDGEETLTQRAKCGFFDIPSGCFSGLKWSDIWPWCTDSRLIPVIDDTFRAGYADRTTGEMVIPCQYFCVDPSTFSEGVASVAYEDEDGDPLDFFLIDETGAEIPLPDGIHAVQYEGAVEGRIKISNDEGLFGFADSQGAVIIPPQFTYANRFKDGFAVVQYPEGDWACIDPDGQVLVRGLQADHWSGPDFRNGMYTCQTGEHEFSVIDMQGQTVLVFSAEDLVELYPPDEDGLCLFHTDTSGRDNYWTNNRRYGYVSLSGEIVMEPHLYRESDSSPVYENGLAFVRIDNRCGYIDREGNEVYMWETE